MSNLEKCYNERFKQKGDPEFKDLSNEDKKAIENSFGFACYEHSIAWKELSKVTKDMGKALWKAFPKGVLK